MLRRRDVVSYGAEALVGNRLHGLALSERRDFMAMRL